MSKITNPKGRYEIRDVVGEGGMGVVYRAFDPVMNREVTLKTIRDPQDTAVLELFRRECAVLASLAHPNIVEIFDIGESDDGSVRRPFFVMPLLKGVTLDQLIRSGSPRLSIERCIQMIGQICRGLQVAHDQGLVHRDLKPANIFVLEDDSIKIIDFGVAHLSDQRSVTGLKGTLLYMAPEQLQHLKPTPISDQFSLAVISYEMLTRRHPFGSPGRDDLAQAMIRTTPAPASHINPAVSHSISQVIHKALAKEPYHRFANVREYADCLQKALRNEPIEVFHPSRIEPRLLRAQKAFDEGDWDFAAEIVRELKSESYLNPEIDRLDNSISEALRNNAVEHLLDAARRRFQEQEHLLALQKIQEALNLDPSNRDAIQLRNAIETSRDSRRVEESLRVAQQLLENRAFAQAREGIEKLLTEKPDDARTRAILEEIVRQEREAARLKVDRQQAYEAALQAFRRGDVDTALAKLERHFETDPAHRSVLSPEEVAYQKFYDEVRVKRDQLRSQEAGARKHLAEGRFEAALCVCASLLAESPENVVYKFLRNDAEQGRRREISAFVAGVEKEVAEEDGLNRKVAILEEAQARYPQEQRIEHSLFQVRSRKDLVDSIVKRARTLEAENEFSEALAQWETLGSVHPQYPGLSEEKDRLAKLVLKWTKDAAKANWVALIDQAAKIRNYSSAATIVKDALAEFPGDQDLLSLGENISRLTSRQSKVADQLAQARKLDGEGKLEEALDLLRSAVELAPDQQSVRGALIDSLLKRAGAILDSDWLAAGLLVNEALAIEPRNALAKNLNSLIADKKHSEEVAQCLADIRILQGEGKTVEAIQCLDRAAEKYPREPRLIQVRDSLSQTLSASEGDKLRVKDLQELKRLEAVAKAETDVNGLDTIFEQTRLYRTKYAGEPEFADTLIAIEDRVNSAKGRTSVPEQIPVKAGKGQGVAWLWLHPLWYATAGFALVAVFLFGIFLARRQVHLPARDVVVRIPVAFVADNGVIYRIENATGTDVTSSVETGLVPGVYRLKATRPGFAPVDQPFKLESSFRSHRVTPVWTALPAWLLVRSTPRGVTLLNGQPMTMLGNGDFATELPSGLHTLQWSLGTYVSKLELEVKDGKVTAQSLTASPRVGAIFAVTGLDKITYQTANLGPTFPPPTELPLSVGGEVHEIKSPTGATLVKLPQVDAAHSASVLLTLSLQPPRAPARAATPQPETTPVSVTPVVVSTAPSAEQIRQEQQAEADKRREEKVRRLRQRAGEKP